jgi:hypothetical protein
LGFLVIEGVHGDDIRPITPCCCQDIGEILECCARLHPDVATAYHTALRIDSGLSAYKQEVLFRRFVGLSMDDRVWDPTVFTKNRERLLRGDIARAFFERVLAQAKGASTPVRLAQDRGPLPEDPTEECAASAGCSPWAPRCTTWYASGI